MKQRVFKLATLSLGALAVTAGCAEILGLEPPDTGSGTGGNGGAGGTTTTSGGSGGSGGCKVDSDCPSAQLPPCTKPFCDAGTCGSAPADDGEMTPCYSGPPITENVGTCKSGLRTCQNGVPGECIGEVLPTQDICATLQDEDCDGKQPECPGGLLQVVKLAGSEANDARAVQVDLEGNYYVAGVYHDALDFGGCSLPAPVTGTAASYVARLAPDLTCSWIAAVGDGTANGYLSHLTLAAGKVWAIGTIAGPATIKDGVGAAAGPIAPVASDALVFALDKKDGAFFGWYLVGGVDQDSGAAITASADTVYALSKGGTGLVSSSKDSATSYAGIDADGADMIVTAIDPVSGKIAWVRAYGTDGDDEPAAIAVHDTRLVLGGSVGPSLAAGNADPVCLVHMGSNPRAFVFDTDASGDTGVPQLCGTFTSGGPSVVTGLWASPTEIVAAGYSVGVTDLGCGSSNGGDSAATSGWYRATSTSSIACTHDAFLQGATQVFGIHAERVGQDVILGGSYTGQLFGATSQGQDVFLARLAEGKPTPVWSAFIASDALDTFGDFAVSPVDGTIVVVGSCAGKALAGQVDCDFLGDGFLARFSP